MKQFYIYVHCRPNGEPFYVGKGSGKRARLFSSNRTLFYKNIVAKYGRENILVYTRNCESEQQAHKHEVWMIVWCRAQGYRLTNMSDGGEGSSGHKVSEEIKQQIALAMVGNTNNKKGRKFSEVHKANISAAKKGKSGFKPSQETKNKIAASIKAGAPFRKSRGKDTEAVRLKKSLGHMGEKHSLERIRKSCLSRFGYCKKPKNK